MSELSTEYTLQVLVSSDADRDGLRQMLGDRYTLRFEQSFHDADCYLLTSRTLPEYIDQLEREKQRSEPAFCPVLLIQQSGSRLDDAFLASKRGQRLVDDIMTAPVGEPVLRRRLENLLSRRSQSIALSRQYERAESWFQGVFNALPDPSFVIDTDGSIQEINAAFCEFTGSGRAELLDMKLSALAGTVPAFEELPEMDTTPGNWMITTGDGSTLPADGDEMESVLLSTQATQVDDSTYIIGILSDVTELQTKTDRLEKLASVLSHDLRNPVQVASLHLTNLAEMYPESRERIEPIQRAIDRIEELTEELVVVARTGENMALEPLAVEASAREAWTHVDTGEAELVLEAADSHLEGDSNRLLQLFENLFRNAVDHGGPEATVWVGCESYGFYVEDDGPGIPAEKHDAVLELGYSTAPHGNGLGLGIVREIAAAHGWDIRITDGRAGGARFELRGIELFD